MFSSLIVVIAFINETQVSMHDKSNFINNPHLFTSMYIQRTPAFNILSISALNASLRYIGTGLQGVCLGGTFRSN